jgi:hypothetical protein
VFFWGEADLIWTQGVIELYRWRRQRKAQAAQAAQLIAETEAFLAERHGIDLRTADSDSVEPQVEPPRPSEPPRFS